MHEKLYKLRDAAVQELLYLGMRSEELRRRIPEGGTNHD